MEKRNLTVEDREVFLSDLQIPFQDDLAVEVALELARDFRPTIVWLGGDVADMYSLAGWTISRESPRLSAEIEATRAFLQRLRGMFPKARIFWQEGNHEVRLRTYILKRASDIEFLLKTKASMESLYDLNRLKVRYVAKPAKLGRLYHIHGHEKHSGSSQLVHVALSYVRWLHRNVIFGHWHTIQNFPIKEIDGSYKEAYANGCLFDMSKMPYGGYSPVDLAMRGISLVTYAKSDFFHVEQIKFIDTKTGYYISNGEGPTEYSNGEKKKSNVYIVR